jgi:hypothetical protein
MPVVRRKVDVACSDTTGGLEASNPAGPFAILGIFCGRSNDFCGTIGVVAVVAGTRPLQRLRGSEVPVTFRQERGSTS